MTNKQKNNNKKKGYTPEEKARLLELMKKQYPKHPDVLLKQILDVEEKRLYGSKHEQSKINNILSTMPDNSSQFVQTQLEFAESKGYKVEEKEK